METLLHTGLEHPNVVWLVATAVLAFLAGVGVTAYRSVSRDERPRPNPANDLE